jgi:MFS family permease
LCLYLIKPQPLLQVSRKLVFKRKYWLFYSLNIVFGARKQIFLTFAPWVLIRIFNCGVETFALLGLIGTVLSLAFRPLLGRAIDVLGERTIIIAESMLLIIMSILYGFSPSWFPSTVALTIIMACFIADQMLFAVRMARTTYLNRIVDSPEDLSATISMGLTLDHAVSMLIPLGGGLLWTYYGYLPVFLFSGFIALLNLILARFIPARPPISAVDVPA